MKKFLLLLAISLTNGLVFSQNYPMPAGTNNISVCTGTFFDSGGPGSGGGTRYTNGENRTYTICPSTAGTAASVTFTSFDVATDDMLYVFDGSTTGSPLIGAYNNGVTGPTTITASTANGCLTFQFVSDANNRGDGWSATIACATPATPIIWLSNGNKSTCGASFFDPGGPSFAAANNLNLTYTICPSTPGAMTSVSFSAFNLDNNYDYLYIYDGNSIAAPLVEILTGTAIPPTVQATGPTGCLTFRFTSDGAFPSNGWVATVSCFSPCQTITANLVSTTPAVTMPGNMVRACQNQSINFVGSGTFSTSGTGATYSWNFGDGTTGSGTNVNHSYATGGSYLVNLTITDPNGCTNSNSISQLVQVSTTPTIVTSATPSPLCTNQISHLTGNATPVTATVNCTPPVSGTTFLPDGSGVSYNTTITTDCYPAGSMITAATDFVSLCLNMEHSYLGDLGIQFICPNGTAISLKTYNTGTAYVYLGSPNDPGTTNAADLAAGPGTGRVYCFTPSASVLLINGTTSTAGNVAYNSINAGDYMPAQPFSNLIGCPLNGTWTIRITDNISADNGYIFNWGFTLNTALTGIPSFTPTIVSQTWTPAATLYNISTNQADALATSMATYPYNFAVTDNFGCTYNATQNVVVNCTSLPAGLVSFDAKALSNNRVELRWITESEHNTNRFEIDRSVDGENWEFVTAAQAAGDSEEELIYGSTDTDPKKGVSYYRLRTIDNDGTQSVSDIDVVTINPDEGTLIVYPNPATDILMVEGNDEDLESMRIINAVGQDITALVGRNSDIPSKLQLDIHNLVKGTYMIKTGTSSYLIVKQ